MILVAGIWIGCFIIIYLVGFSIKIIYEKLSKSETRLSIDEIYFTGFIILAILAGYLSILFPLNYYLLGVISLYAFLVLVFNKQKIYAELEQIGLKTAAFQRRDKVILLLLFGFIIFCSSFKIHPWDTGLYHTQAIKWIREYAVVPGLGNLHNRFALNSMFFPISSIFTIEVGSLKNFPAILIYPINGITLLVLLFKEYFFIKKNYATQNWQNVIFGLIISFLCIYYFAIRANSASPDIITAVLTIYLVQQALYYKNSMLSSFRFTFFACLIFICITFKLSTLFLFLLLIPMQFFKNWQQNIQLVPIVAIVIITPFLIRNYYLSGYLVYPLYAIDFFQTDWKIPLQEVIDIKNWIELKAKMPMLKNFLVDVKNFETFDLTIGNWIGIWFKKEDAAMKLILVLNFLYIIYTSFKLIIKKQRSYAILHLILFANLLFWFFNAPDTRFAYGFLFLGLAFFMADMVHLVEKIKLPKHSLIKRFAIPAFCLIITFMILFKYVKYIKPQVKNTTFWLYPKEPQRIETNIHHTNFDYYSPAEGTQCFNASIPCTPYPNEKLLLRKSNLQDGFRISND